MITKATNTTAEGQGRFEPVALRITFASNKQIILYNFTEVGVEWTKVSGDGIQVLLAEKIG